MGLNDKTRYQIETIYEYEFLDQPIEQGWNMYLWLARDTYRKEMPNSPPLDIPIAYSFDLVGNDGNSTFGCLLIDRNEVASSLALSSSSPCHLSIGCSSDDVDESIYENEDLRNFA